MPIFSRYWQAIIDWAVAGILMHTRSLRNDDVQYRCFLEVKSCVLGNTVSFEN